MTDIEKRPHDPWSKTDAETTADYSAFVSYCRLGPRRNVKKLAFELGTTSDYYTALARRHSWKKRATAYDEACNNLVPGAEEMDVHDTNVWHFAVGKALIDLGVRAFEMKNPGQIRSADATKLIALGIKSQREATGQESGHVKVTVNTKSVEKLNEILEEIEIVEAEEVPEEQD